MRGFISVEPFELRVEALIRPQAFDGAGKRGRGLTAAEQQTLIGQYLADFAAKVSLTSEGKKLEFPDRSARFVRFDAEKGYLLDDREEIPIDEAIVGLTLSTASSELPSFDLEWTWFAPRQERLVVEISSRGKPAARVLTPKEMKTSWRFQGEAATAPTLLSVPEAERDSSRPLRWLALVGLVMIAAASGIVLRRKTETRAWVAWLFAVGLALATFGLRYHVDRVFLPAEETKEKLLYVLLRNAYHAFDFHDESSIYDTLAKSISGPLLEKVYLEVRSSLELESEGGPRVRVYEIDLRECQDASADALSLDQGFRVRARWTTVGVVTHWGHTHTRLNRYEALISLIAEERSWKIGKLDLLNEERIQRMVRVQIPEEEKQAPERSTPTKK